MGTSKSYLPKVTKNTTQTKLNITNMIKSGGLNDSNGLARIVNSFKHSLSEDSAGLKKGNYGGAISVISGVVSAISSSSIGGYVNSRFSDNEKSLIQSPQDLFNAVIRNEEYLTEFEKANLLEAIARTLEDLHIDELADFDSIDCDLFFKTFIANLIYSLFVSSYYEHIGKKTANPEKTNNLCREIKTYIEGRILSDNALSVKLMNDQTKMDEYAKSVIDEVLSLL